MTDTQQKPTTVRELLRVAAAWLTEKGVEGADLDTQLLLSHTLGCRRLDLFLDHDRELTSAERDAFRALMVRRGQREPVAYIVGERAFHALNLTVDRRVLVPRPETEHLVEVAVEFVKGVRKDTGVATHATGLAPASDSTDTTGLAPAPDSTATTGLAPAPDSTATTHVGAGLAPAPGADVEDATYVSLDASPAPSSDSGESVYVPIVEHEAEPEATDPEPRPPVPATAPAPTPVRFADVGTGSGCIALALLHELPIARGLAIDVSPDALEVARANAEACGALDRLELVQGNLLTDVAPGSLDLVVSNPPYIPPSERHLLAPEVADHEPALALFDEEGLPLTAELVRQAAVALRPGGFLAIETGFQTADLVASFLEREGFTDVRRIKDLARIDRVVCGRRAE